MRTLVLCLAVTASTLSASAATHNTTNALPTTKVVRPAAQWVQMSFRNSSVTSRVLTVGENSYTVQPGKAVTLNMMVGSNVHLSSPQDSRVDSNLLQISTGDDRREILVR